MSKNHFSLVTYLTERIGRRGLVLLLLSTVSILIAVKAFVQPSFNLHGEFMLYSDIPPVIRSFMWFAAAVCGIAAALFRKGSNDALGFAALCVPTSIIGASYFMSFVGFLFGINGDPLGWVDALEWGTILAMLVIISGWEEVNHDVTYYKLVEKKEVQ